MDAFLTSEGLLALVTLTFLEIILGVDPDNHDGSLEWIIVVACLCIAVIFAVLARQQWRKAAHSI